MLRNELKELIDNSIIVKYKLPFNFLDKKGKLISSGRSNLSTPNRDEYCFEGKDGEIAKIIYNGIVEFAENEFNIDYQCLNKEQTKTIKLKLRYESSDSSKTKLQYGFYGEVLLDLLLRNFFHTDVLISRGYFYSPLEKSEPKGFDAFHLIDRNGELELWFGEAKFHRSFTSGINSVLSKMNGSLSNEYLNSHLLAIIKERSNISHSHAILNEVIDKWNEDPDIVLVEELQNYNIELVYPIFIAYQKQSTYSYEETISSCVLKINQELQNVQFSTNLTIKVSIFIMLLPVDNSNKLKEEVLEWIENKVPLI